MSDHDSNGSADDPDGADGADEALPREVLGERAALADGAAIPDVEALVAGGPGTTRRLPAVALLSIAACVVLVVGAVVVTATRRSTDVAIVAASPAELLESLKSSDGAQAFAFELERTTTQGSAGSGGCSSASSQRGRVDPATGVAAIEVEGGELTMTRDGDGSITASLLPSSWGIEAPTLRFTLEQAARAGTALGPTSPLTGGGGNDPFGSIGAGPDLAERFDQLRRAATEVEVVGDEAIRGVDTTHVVVLLGHEELAAMRAEANDEGAQALVEAGLLTPDQAAMVTGAPDISALGGVIADNDQRVDAWIDDDGLVRRLVTTTTLRSSTTSSGPLGPAGPPGSAVDTSTTTYATTIEAFDHGQVSVAAPDAGADAIDMGSLPAEVLRPVEHDGDDEGGCGQAPTPQLQGCAESAFVEATEGRIVDELLATIPKTFEALVTPNSWFDGCVMGMSPITAPTQEQMSMLLGLNKIDDAMVQQFLDLTETVPSLATSPRDVRLYQAVTACPAVRSGSADLELTLSFYDPRMVVDGLSREGYRELLGLLTDPAVTICR